MLLRSKRNLEARQSIDNKTVEKKTKTGNEFLFMTLPDHIKEHILDLSDFKTMLVLTETCKELHDLVFKGSCRLMKRVKLSKGSVDDVIRNWKATKRDHKHLELIEFQCNFVNEDLTIVSQGVEHSDETIQSWIEVFKIKGSLIRELTFGIDKFDVVKLLLHCENLEQLRLEMNFDEKVDLERNLNLPKLKILEMKKTRLPCFPIFNNVRSLQTFRVTLNSLSSRFKRSELASQLEDFILRQDNLKHLDVNFFIKRGLVTDSRIKELKFQLDTFRYFFWNEIPKTFNKFLLKQSSSLKSLEIGDLSDFNISILSRLETLTLRKKIDWDLQFVEGKINNSIKKIKLGSLGPARMYSSKELNDIFKVLPNVEEILIEDHCELILSLSTEKLKALKFKNGFKLHNYFKTFLYSPDEPSNDLEKDSENILVFIRHHRQIERIKIEMKCSKELGDSFPDSFEREVRRFLPNLKTFQVTVIPV